MLVMCRYVCRRMKTSPRGKMLMQMGLLSGQMGSAVPQRGGRCVSLAPQASVLTEMGGSGWGCLTMHGSAALGSRWLVCPPCLGPRCSSPGAPG